MVDNHILVVEDERKIASLLKDYLQKDGYRVSITSKGNEALAIVKKNEPALMLLDIMLPGMDGISICREVRKFSNLPIIMVTAKVEEIDRLIGLEIGADDYICKPFSPREVVARVKTVLRRVHPQEISQKLTAGPIVLDETTREVAVGASSINLTPSEFALLKILMRRPGRVFSRNELLVQVQGYQVEGYDRTIDSHIKNLRKKTSEVFSGQDLIQTVYGVGYKLVSEIDE